MNARQKAKYYKRRYEEVANVRINPLIINKSSLDEYRIMKTVTFPGDVLLDQDLVKDRLAISISENLVDFIKDNMSLEIKESFDNSQKASAEFNFWYKRQ